MGLETYKICHTCGNGDIT